MLISNAKRLTGIVCHSPNLINTDLSNCTYMREIDISDCTVLGTGIGAQPTLNLANLKYLTKIDARNTQLTAIYTNTTGGNIEEIYYPASIQQIVIHNQTHLHTIGLPYDEDEDIWCEKLNSVELVNCPNIEKMMYPYDATANQFLAFKYVQNITITNSLRITDMNFKGFNRLRSVSLNSLSSLVNLGFDDMALVGETSTIQSISLNDIPNVTVLTMNISSAEYSVSLAENSTLDLSGANSIRQILCNCPTQGLATIILPYSIEDLRFTNEFNISRTCSILNLWSPDSMHEDDGFQGIDFLNLNVKNIDMSSLRYISEALNFKIAPTDVNPNFNTGRDGFNYKYFLPEGEIDLTNYIGSLSTFFAGLDMSKLKIHCNKDLPQSDFTGCFQNCIGISDIENITSFLVRMKNVKNLSYMFSGSDITGLNFIESLPRNSGMILDYEFKDCLGLTNGCCNGLVLNNQVSSAIGMLQGCTNLTDMQNLNIQVLGSVAYFAQGCSNLVNVSGTLRNVTDTRYMFANNSKQVGYLDCVPATCKNFAYMYYGCGITSLSNFILYEANINDTYNTNLDIEFLFQGCPLERVENCTFNMALGAYYNSTRSFSIFPSTLKYFNSTLGSNVTRLDSAFQNSAIEYCKVSGGNITQMRQTFGYTTNTSSLAIDIDTSKVSNMFALFKNSSYSNVSFGDKWSVARVLNMQEMFMNSKIVNIDFLSSWDFSECTNLGSFLYGNSRVNSDLVINGITSKTTNCSELLRNCTTIPKVTFNNCDFSNATMSNCFYGLTLCTNMTFDNCKFPSAINNTNMIYSGAFYTLNLVYRDCVFAGKPFPHQRNINSHLYERCDFSTTTDWSDWYTNWGGHGSYAFYMDFVDCIWSTGLIFDRMFKGTNIQSDIAFPNTVMSAIECFNGCKGIKTVHSNWNTEYTRDITPTNCYTGCTGIQTIDGVVVVNDYSTGLDEVPTAWGGYGFTKEVTGIYRITVPTDNYTFTWVAGVTSNSGLMGTQTVNWGDGTTSTGTREHVYSTGTYIIKGNLRPVYNAYTTSMAECIVDVLQLPNNASSGGAFRGWTALKTLNIEGLSITSLFYFTQGCKSLHTITGSPRDTANCTSMTNAFANTALTNLDFMKDWEFPKLETADGAFSNISTLKSANIPNFLKYSVGASSNISLKSLFIGDVSLESIDASNWDFSRVSNMSEFIRNCSTIYELDLSNHDMSNVTIMSYFASGCSNLTSLALPKLPKCANILGGFRNSNLRTFDMSCFSEALETAKEAFRDCPKLETITGDYNLPNLYNTQAMFHGCTSLTTELNMDTIDDTIKQWGDSNTHFSTCCANMYSGCTNLVSISHLKIYKYPQTYNSSGSNDIAQGCTRLTSISEYNVDFTQAFPERCSAFITTDYWITMGWRWFYGLTNLSFINFSGTVYFADDFTDYRIFRGFNSNKLDSTTWQKFVNIFPDNSSTGIAKQICVGSNIAYIPTAYAEQLTAKGYTLYAATS